MPRRALLLAATAVACAAPPSPQPTPAPAPAPTRFDLVLRNGTVLDGTGRPPLRADVGIIGAHIAAIGDLSSATATTDVDVKGLHVAPGFVNIHSHANALATAENMLRQGVTTEILNPDGGGPLDIARPLAAAESTGLAVNVGGYAPFNTAWRSVMGDVDRRPSAEEIERIRDALAAALQAGAWGISAGLDYKPAYYATTDEVVRVLEPLRRWRTNFPNHDRLKPEWGYSSLAAIRETIEIGERAGLVPVITHMKLQGIEQGRAAEAVATMRAATRRGTYTAADVYPYLAGQTGLSALFVPGWALEGGREAFLQRLRDSTTRARIVRETEEGMAARVKTPANIYLPSRGRTVAELMPTLGTTSAGEAIARILEQGEATMIATFGAEPDLVELLRYPDAAVACDCGAQRTGAHPRGTGTFPRVLGRYVRETGALTLADAVRKMTGLPATIVGMVDRGFVAVGMAADLAVFDAVAVIDHSTYEKPVDWPEGVRLVTVNGKIALRDGVPTGATGGRMLRRSGSMPSRPMPPDVARAVVVSGGGIVVDVAQGAGDRAARGRVHIANDVLTDAVQLGVLQTAPGWASVTGRGRAAGGEQRAFTLIVDARDPFADGRPTVTVTVRVDGMPDVRAVLADGAVRITP